ncbi:MAG: hypothetical protein COB53_04455 [Elusimicrobia bacterium]|nr:MAG: hypothetical protein COB53_04455 [Elusimicrobiota bacterium]
MPRKRTDTAAKVLSPVKATAWRKRRKGERVVFAGGIYDILHPGHVQLLEAAAALGDRLIVGLNTDASTRRLNKKGPTRPINKLKDRLRVIAALACVDAVTWFGEDTPTQLLAKIKPDILVKGADYHPEQVPERIHAGRLALLKLKRGYSTTGLLKRLTS